MNKQILNTYIESNKQNLDYLLKNGATFGICTKKGLLNANFIAINAFGNMTGFKNIPQSIKSKVTKLKIE